MTPEIKKLVKKMVLDPATAADAAAEIDRLLDTMATAMEADRQKIADMEEEAKKLRDTNIRLYLSATGTKQEKEEEEKTVEELEADFVQLAIGKEE